MRSAGRGLGEAQLSGKDAQGDLKQGLAGAALPACVSLMRQESQTHGALLFPAAKPTNWIEGTHTVLRARKGQDDKVLVATCTSANGKPPSVVSWETRLKGEAEYQEIRNPNGTVTVISRYRLVPSREAHRQSLACIVNYHMDRFRESLTLDVQCERGRVLGAGPPGGGGAHTVPSHRPTLTSPPSVGGGASGRGRGTYCPLPPLPLSPALPSRPLRSLACASFFLFHFLLPFWGHSVLSSTLCPFVHRLPPGLVPCCSYSEGLRPPNPVTLPPLLAFSLSFPRLRLITL